MLRNTLLLGLAGAADSDIDPDVLAEFAAQDEPSVVQDPQARQALIAQLAAG
ncbi:hypothetical protein SAMN05216275_14171 [Streptosporangium canum]|uniref:Uncharacterized protein n=1 Tax=Streptosporangium canum TaxID=324952 RepID=A0A1I4DIL7_9ACTN|nr:hypothetical protein [Streptosporangium canum]SFK92729.1 hypothetical protein SAMN05216275_14171 [Streptosporangium canum]